MKLREQVSRDFKSSKDSLDNTLKAVSTSANNDRIACLSSLTQNLNQILSQALLMDIEDQQSQLERNYRRLPQFQEELADMAKLEIYHRRVMEEYYERHHAERTRRLAFMFLKEYTMTKLHEKRALRIYLPVLAKRSRERLFQAWRAVKFQEKSKRVLHAYTREYEIQVDEHKKLGQKMITQLEQELEKKDLEYLQEERKLNQLNEKYAVLKNADKTVNLLQKTSLQEATAVPAGGR